MGIKEVEMITAKDVKIVDCESGCAKGHASPPLSPPHSEPGSGDDSPAESGSVSGDIDALDGGDSAEGSPRLQARRPSDEKRRANPCTGCAELRRLRRDNKRLEQELRETQNTRYAEEQRTLALLEQVDVKSRETVQLRQKVMHRSKSTFFESWFDVHISGLNTVTSKRGKSREMLWRKLYVVIRGGQLLIYNVNQQQRSSLATPILSMDINCRMSVGKVKETDPEIIATNKDCRKMFKIDYMEPNNNRNSLGKRAATCDVATSQKTVLFEAANIEEKEQWMRMLSEEVAVSGVWYRKTAQASTPSSVKMKDVGCQTDSEDSACHSLYPISALSVTVIMLAALVAYHWMKEIVMGVFIN